MDVIAFLMEDHDRLRRELGKIGKSLSVDTLKDTLRAFVSHYHFHETVEDQMLLSEKGNGDLHGYKWIHSGAQTLLKELQGFAESRHPLYIHRAFSNFQALAQSHFEYEENSVFPAIRKLLDEKVLEDLGRKAEERFKELDEPTGKKARP